MLRALSGLGEAYDRALASIPARLAATGEAVWSELRSAGRLRAGAEPPRLWVPHGFADVLAAALALDEVEPRPDGARVIAQHYLELMPRLRVHQLATNEPPYPAIFHTRVEWDRMPRFRGAVDSYFALCANLDIAPALLLGEGADTAISFFAARPTIAALYERTYFASFMPLLYGYPADMALMQADLDGGRDFHATLDHHLAAPLVHELAHGQPSRALLLPPYIDECLAGHLGVRVMPEFAYPSPGEANAIFHAPWFAQVGQALVRVFGDGVLRAHAGAIPWSEALPQSLIAALLRLGWDLYRRRREPHFLSGNYRPEPWLKLFYAAAAKSVDLEDTILDQLDALDWRDIPPGGEAPADLDILADALRAMCLRNHRRGQTLRADTRPPPAPIHVDLAACRVTTAPGADGLDPTAPAYLFPPPVAARLRAAGKDHFDIDIRDTADIPDVARAILDGSAR